MPKIEIRDVEDRWNPKNMDEHMWWPRVQWIDPGTVSGLAVVWFDPVALFEGKILSRTILAYSEMFLSGPEDGPNGQANRFMRVRRSLALAPGLASGCESFTINSIKRDEEFLSPVRLRSKISFAMSMEQFELLGDDGEPTGQYGFGSQLHVQSPSDAMNAFTNDRLKGLRMYTPGPDHINDAKRHCLLWIRKLQKAGREFFAATHGDEPGWWK